MSEVEALCDRVAILRQGRLVELGALAQLRHLSALTVDVTFAGAVPDLTGVPGVSNVAAHDHGVHLNLRGPMAPLVRALAGAEVTELVSREPSLEELFLVHYGNTEDSAQASAAAGTADGTPAQDGPEGEPR